MGEFGLAVSTEVLVAEATGDLVITVEAGDHKHLLPHLRGLGQGVERAMVDAARNEIFLRAFGRREVEHRGLDLQEIVLLEIFAGRVANLAADMEVALQSGTAKVQITVLEAGFLESVGLIRDDERGGLGFVDDRELFDVHFNFAGGQVGVRDIFGLDGAFHLNDIFVADVGKIIRVRGDALDDASRVAKVQKQQGTKVPALRNPADQRHFGPDVGFAEGPVIMVTVHSRIFSFFEVI